MQPLGVIKRDDVVGDVHQRFLVVGMAPLPDSFHRQVKKKPLHDGVIPTIALAAHAGDQAVPFKQGLVQLPGVLTAAVAVDDQPKSC